MKFEDDFKWPDMDKMTDAEVRQELAEARQRFDVLEKDLQKSMADCRKLNAQVK